MMFLTLMPHKMIGRLIEAEMESYICPMDVDEMRDFVASFREIKSRGLSQEQVAKICGISQARVSNIIHLTGNVSLEYMLGVCENLVLISI